MEYFLLVFVYQGWTTESLLGWGQFIKLAVSGMLMICIEWWSFEVGAFLTGKNKIIFMANDDKRDIKHADTCVLKTLKTFSSKQVFTEN